MKKVLLSLLCLSALTASAQVCQDMQCETPTALSGTLSGANYSTSVCFEAISDATISNSCNFNGWDYITLNGPITMSQSLNFNGTRKLYTGAEEVTLAYISMDGSDTIFAGGDLVVSSFVTNNSTAGQENVIVKAQGYDLTVCGTSYEVGDTIFRPGNMSNKILVLECEGTPLPIHVKTFKATKRNGQSFIEWDVYDAGFVTIQQSNDGKAWRTLADGLFSAGNIQAKPEGKLNLYRLKMGQEYSHALRLDFPFLNDPTHKPVYTDLSGRTLSEEPQHGFYFVDGEKMVRP